MVNVLKKPSSLKAGNGMYKTAGHQTMLQGFLSHISTLMPHFQLTEHASALVHVFEWPVNLWSDDVAMSTGHKHLAHHNEDCFEDCCASRSVSAIAHELAAAVLHSFGAHGEGGRLKGPAVWKVLPVS